jgi:hypothetical protein
MFLRSVLRLLVTANVVPISPILSTMMMEALTSTETSVLRRAIKRNIPEDAFLKVSPYFVDIRVAIHCKILSLTHRPLLHFHGTFLILICLRN